MSSRELANLVSCPMKGFKYSIRTDRSPGEVHDLIFHLSATRKEPFTNHPSILSVALDVLISVYRRIRRERDRLLFVRQWQRTIVKIEPDQSLLRAAHESFPSLVSQFWCRFHMFVSYPLTTTTFLSHSSRNTSALHGGFPRHSVISCHILRLIETALKLQSPVQFSFFEF
jgi:hypothetical protein